jgi:hypothetical protein
VTSATAVLLCHNLATMSLQIPTTMTAFDASWLTEALDHAGVATAAVTAVDAEPIAVGEGFLGELARLHLTYAEPGAGPATAIAKIPTADGGLKPLGTMLGVYERESRFYDEIAPRLDIRVPAVWFNGADPATETYALLMEDVGHFRRGDHLDGADLADARAVVRAAAKLHARWWDEPDLMAMEWVPPMNSPLNMSLQGIYEASWPLVMDRYGHLYPDELVTALEGFIPRISEFLVGWAEISRTLTHNDFRLDNLLFDDRADADPEVVVLDFQVIGRGDGSGDLAPFLGCNLDTELRRAHEMDLMRLYHDTMAEAGVGFSNFDDLVRQTDTAHLFWLVNWGNNAVTADAANERAVSLMDTVVSRYVTTVVDRDSIRYVDDLAWRPT